MKYYQKIENLINIFKNNIDNIQISEDNILILDEKEFYKYNFNKDIKFWPPEIYLKINFDKFRSLLIDICFKKRKNKYHCIFKFSEKHEQFLHLNNRFISINNFKYFSRNIFEDVDIDNVYNPWSSPNLKFKISFSFDKFKNTKKILKYIEYYFKEREFLYEFSSLLVDPYFESSNYHNNEISLYHLFNITNKYNTVFKSLRPISKKFRLEFINNLSYLASLLKNHIELGLIKIYMPPVKIELNDYYIYFYVGNIFCFSEYVNSLCLYNSVIRCYIFEMILALIYNVNKNYIEKINEKIIRYA